MLRYIRSTVLVVAAISAFGGTGTAEATSIRIPFAPIDELIPQHPIVGDWVERTTAGAVLASFAADGSVVINFPDEGLGSSFVGAGFGSWEPVGHHGVVYTVVRSVSLGNRMHLGTITIQGYLTLSDDGATFTDDGRLTVITTRDPRNLISSVTGVSASEPVIVGSRVGVGQTGTAHEPVAGERAVAELRVGCQPCP